MCLVEMCTVLIKIQAKAVVFLCYCYITLIKQKKGKYYLETSKCNKQITEKTM